jgi:anti-sigma B factor antagonist
MLRTNVRVIGETAIIGCEGRLVAGEEVQRLKDAVLCHQDSRTVILDMGKLEMIDGSGLGLLAFIAGWTRVVGTEVKLVNPTRRVREVLHLTKLDSVLEVCPADDFSQVPANIAGSCIEHGIFAHAH